jgi:acetyl esterase/lipase
MIEAFRELLRAIGRSMRLRWQRWLAAIGVAIVAIGVVFVLNLVRLSTPATPDAFYTPPDPLPAGPPGTIIRQEPIAQGIPEGTKAFRILYLSIGLDGKPVAVSGVVMGPLSPATEPRPVIAWTHGTVGVVSGCGTSHTSDPFKYIPDLAALVRDGYIVTATDYPGLGTPGIHPYLIGSVEAASALDSVRAAQNLGVGASNRFAVWGHSQGGHAALWTAQSAAKYAPELELVAVAAAAPATDLTAMVRASRDTKPGGILVPEALYAWDAFYPDADFARAIKPEYLDQETKIARICITTPAAFLTVAGGDIPIPAQFLALDPTETEPWKTIGAENSPTGPIAAPILIAHGAADGVVPYEFSVAEVGRRCAAGERVLFLGVPGGTHDDGIHLTQDVTAGWIEDRFAGKPAPTSCG